MILTATKFSLIASLNPHPTTFLPMKIPGTILLVLLVVAVAIVAAGCMELSGKNPSGAPDALAVPMSAERNASAEKLMIDANNRFAFDLYSNLSRSPDNTGRNLFFSPYSISSAFAITYEGARGKTADEIRSVFYFPENATDRRLGYAGIYDNLNHANTSYTLRSANALWTDRSYPFLPAYISTAEQNYGATATSLDLLSHPEESRLKINRQVAGVTGDRINNILPEDSLDSDTALVLTSAIYFKGAWETPFSRDATTEQVFRVSPNTTTRVPMMQQMDGEAELPYMVTATFQALEFPYESSGGKNLSMLVILPKNDNLTAVEDALDLQQIARIRQSLKSHEVKVSFPKFSLESTYELPETLSAMGMPAVFGKEADLSGMDGGHFLGKGLQIDRAIHSAFIDVNEEGTEASAATAFVGTFSPSPVFRADHPFVFLIEDMDSGNILFMGRVVDPSAE